MDLATMIQSLGTDYTSRVNNAVNSTITAYNNTQEMGVSKTQESFDTIYQSAVGLLNSTNDYIQAAEQAEIDFALGKISSTHELGVIQQKANLALSYTVAIRDKVLEGYKEIMNMQI